MCVFGAAYWKTVYQYAALKTLKQLCIILQNCALKTELLYNVIVWKNDMFSRSTENKSVIALVAYNKQFNIKAFI